jgi:hypothetical protein
MWGHSEVPAIEGDKVRDVMVVSTGRGGGADISLRGLHAALVEMFAQDGVAKHLRKVAEADADERHLCLLIHRGALPFAVADGFDRAAFLVVRWPDLSLCSIPRMRRISPYGPSVVLDLGLASGHGMHYDALHALTGEEFLLSDVPTARIPTPRQ